MILGIILGLVIVLILFVLYTGEMYHFNVTHLHNKLDKALLYNTEFRTGDLIMFRFDYPHKDLEYYEMIISCMPYSFPFSHIGMVVIINQIPYITHIANYKIADGNGNCTGFKSDLFDLYDYLDNYEGNVYHCKYVGIPLDNYHLYKRMEIYENLNFKLDGITLIDSLLKTDITNRKHNTITCSSYVTQLLADSKIVDQPYNPNHCTPNSTFIDAYRTGNYAQPTILINKFLLGLPSKLACQ